MRVQLVDLAGKAANPALTEQTNRIKGWVREVLQLSDEVIMRVVELRCPDEGCPDVETVIAILAGGAANQKYKLLKPLDAVTHADITALATASNS